MSKESWRKDLEYFYQHSWLRQVIKCFLFPLAIYFRFKSQKKKANKYIAPNMNKVKTKGLLLSLYSHNNQRVMELTLLNHAQYCTRHNLSMIYFNEPYSPFLDIKKICSFFDDFDFIIVIGTDIIFTDFNKDVRDFITAPIVVQDEGTGNINGDFIIFSDKMVLKKLETQLEDKSYESTQDALSSIPVEYIKIYPPRSLQSIAPQGNADKINIKNLIWKPGDFSIHFHQPGNAPSVKAKELAIREFLQDNILGK